MFSVFEDLSGNTYGYIYVIERCEDYIVPSTGKHAVMFLCRCNKCGRIFKVRKSSLTSGYTTTCGKCMSYLVGDDPIKLGIYRAAQGIIDRTTDSNRHDWKDYGGRGIKNKLGDDIIDAFKIYQKYLALNLVYKLIE